MGEFSCVHTSFCLQLRLCNHVSTHDTNLVLPLVEMRLGTVSLASAFWAPSVAVQHPRVEEVTSTVYSTNIAELLLNSIQYITHTITLLTAIHKLCFWHLGKYKKPTRWAVGFLRRSYMFVMIVALPGTVLALCCLRLVHGCIRMLRLVHTNT